MATYTTASKWLKSRSNTWGSKRKGGWLRGAATRRRAAEGAPRMATAWDYKAVRVGEEESGGHVL